MFQLLLFCHVLVNYTTEIKYIVEVLRNSLIGSLTSVTQLILVIVRIIGRCKLFEEKLLQTHFLFSIGVFSCFFFPFFSCRFVSSGFNRPGVGYLVLTCADGVPFPCCAFQKFFKTILAVFVRPMVILRYLLIAFYPCDRILTFLAIEDGRCFVLNVRSVRHDVGNVQWARLG